MPVYNVNRGIPAGAWNVGAAPPPGFPISNLVLANSQAVAMGAQVNIALGGGVTGLHTNHLTACSAICVLWRPGAAGAWTQAALNHMMGGPDPNAVAWGPLIAGMGGAGGTFVAILANSQPTVLSAGFLVAIAANIPGIPAGNIWQYDANHPGGAINFGVDLNGIAGEC